MPRQATHESGKTVAEARSGAAQAASVVIASLDRNKVERTDIQTDSFSIQPRYAQEKDRVQRIVGYTVTNTVSAKIRDLPGVSRVVDDDARRPRTVGNRPRRVSGNASAQWP